MSQPVISASPSERGVTPFDLSIIVPAYNEEDLIVNTLDALQNYFMKRNESFEIIVVDDGSRDKTVALVEDWDGCGLPYESNYTIPIYRGGLFSLDT